MNGATAYLHLPGLRRRQNSHSGRARWRNRRATPPPRQQPQPRRPARPDARPLLAQALRKLAATENLLLVRTTTSSARILQAETIVRHAKRQSAVRKVRRRVMVHLHIHLDLRASCNDGLEQIAPLVLSPKSRRAGPERATTASALAAAPASLCLCRRSDSTPEGGAAAEAIVSSDGCIGGLVQLTVRVKPARKARTGRDPATGEQITIVAQPASVDVRARPLARTKRALPAVQKARRRLA